MKKLFNTFLLLLALVSSLSITACSKKTKLTQIELKTISYQHENLTVNVDPKIELLLVGLRLSEQEPFNQNAYGQEYAQYLEGVDKICGNQKNHPFVKTLKSHYDSKKTNATDILKISRYISDDITSISIKNKELPTEMQQFWKKINLKQFIADMNDFAVKSNFTKVWVLYNPQLKSQAINNLDYYKSMPQITDWISDFYFAKDNKPDYQFFASTGTAGYMFIPTLIKKDNKIIVQNYLPAYSYNKDNLPYTIVPAYYLSFAVAYTYTVENWELISEDYNKLLDKIIEDNQITYKYKESEKQNLFANLIANVCVLNYEVAQNDEEIYTQFKNQIEQYYYYKDPDKLISLLDVYIDNRDKYLDFESFFKDFIPSALKDL